MSPKRTAAAKERLSLANGRCNQQLEVVRLGAGRGARPFVFAVAQVCDGMESRADYRNMCLALPEMFLPASSWPAFGGGVGREELIMPRSTREMWRPCPHVLCATNVGCRHL